MPPITFITRRSAEAGIYPSVRWWAVALLDRSPFVGNYPYIMYETSYYRCASRVWQGVVPCQAVLPPVVRVSRLMGVQPPLPRSCLVGCGVPGSTSTCHSHLVFGWACSHHPHICFLHSVRLCCGGHHILSFTSHVYLVHSLLVPVDR